MPRPSKSGVRGLFKEVRFFDAKGEPVSKPDALARIKAGERLKRQERYYIDLRWKEAKTGQRMRHQERLPDNVNAATAKTRAAEIMNGTKAGTFEKNPEAPKRLHEALDEFLGWSKTNRPQSHATTKSIVKIVKDAITDRPLSDLAPFDLERFKRDREKQGACSCVAWPRRRRRPCSCGG